MIKYAKENKEGKIIIIPNGIIPKGWIEVTQEEFNAEKAQKKQEELDKLSMTRGDMFEALILAFGKTKADIRKMIEDAEDLTDMERALYLNRFDEALDFYRGYPVINFIGQLLGVTSEQLDRFFETKDYKELLSAKKESKTEETNSVGKASESSSNQPANENR